jgi:SRSO17 transposase
MIIPQRVSTAMPPPSGRKSECNITRRDVKGLTQKLKGYHKRFSPLFFRKEQRHWALWYMAGQMLGIERKAIEPMALALEGGDVEAMQQFISVGAWKDEPIILEHQGLVAETLGEPEGVVILDGCDFPKQGEESVGVARQWCGALGKVANCQASVIVVYASSKGYTMIDRRLYLPQEWFEADHRERWEKCGIPEGTVFRTKPELGWAMIEPLIQRGVVPFQWIVMDEGYGRDTRLLNRINEHKKYYLAEVPHSTRGWRQPPKTERVPARPSSPNHSPRRRLVRGARKAKHLDAVAKRLKKDQWQRFSLQEGSKGPLVVDIAALRMTVVEDKLPGREDWIIFRRSVTGAPELKIYRCNAPADTPLETLARMASMRWPVEKTIEETKTELGMDHYEVRGWTGWHHHMTMTMLSHHFLVQLRVEMGDQAPALTVSQVRQLLNVTLPKRDFDEQAVIDEILRTQQRNRAAYLSHRKRKLRELRKLSEIISK